jgi:hypothetical protein
VATADVGGLPGGILVGEVTDLRRTGIRPGMAFVPSVGGWSIPSAGVGIDASRAATWSPTLPAAARLRLTSGLPRTVAAARRLAADRAPAGGLAPMLSGRDRGGGLDGSRGGDPWLTRARALIGIQLEALRIGDVAAAVAPTIGLMGLGVGLTPSGDDYLVGLLAGMDATDDPPRHGLAAVIAGHAPLRTTAVGAAVLGHASRGAFAERLHDVLVALARGRLDELAGPIERAMAYGATSGSDTLVGLFAALDVALARSKRRPGAVA